MRISFNVTNYQYTWQCILGVAAGPKWLVQENLADESKTSILR
jgi:hypothetical protein